LHKIYQKVANLLTFYQHLHQLNILLLLEAEAVATTVVVAVVLVVCVLEHCQ
jgi:hypothetical protein